MNFTYTIEKPPDNSWGSRDGEGNWNGMIRQLMEDKTDICKLLIYHQCQCHLWINANNFFFKLYLTWQLLTGEVK